MLCVLVAPLAGAWIETAELTRAEISKYVAPLAGAWIETLKMVSDGGSRMVAPLAGAWIETLNMVSDGGSRMVAPLAGAWIETPVERSIFYSASFVSFTILWQTEEQSYRSRAKFPV